MINSRNLDVLEGSLILCEVGWFPAQTNFKSFSVSGPVGEHDEQRSQTPVGGSLDGPKFDADTILCLVEFGDAGVRPT